MATRGGKPVPTSLKILRGNPGHRALNDREPKVAAALPDPPKHLNDLARAEWYDTGEQLVNCRVLTRLDKAIFAGYCQWYAEVIRLTEQLEKVGPVIVSQKTKQPYLSPWMSALSMATKHVERLACELGMSPSSRSRIKVDKPEPPKSGKAKLFSEGG